MREAVARSRQRFEDARKKADKAAEAADHALLERDAAKHALHITRLAGKRVNEIVSVFDDRHRDGPISIESATRFAECLVSALLWEHQHEPDRNNITLDFVANVLPDFGQGRIRSIIAESVSMTNAKVGEILEVTLCDVERLGLSMIAPFNLTAAEFKTYREERQKRRDKLRKADAARAAGKPTNQERRAQQAEKKAELEALAKDHGKSVAQIRRDIKSGKIPSETKNAKLGSARDNNRTEFTFASGVAAVAAGAMKAPHAPAFDDNSRPSSVASGFLAEEDRRERMVAALHRAAAAVRVAS